MNRVILMGNITRDIELRNTASSAVASFGLALNRTWKNAAGEKQEEVTFVDCTAWGKTAEIIAQYFAKGKRILVEGRLKLDQWDDKATGAKRSKLTVVVETFNFVDSKSEPNAAKPAAAKTRKQEQPASVIDDEIPF